MGRQMDVSFSFERQEYSMRVAALTGLKDDAVISEVERRRKKLAGRAQKAEEREQSRPERQAQPAEKEYRYTDPGSAAAEEGLIRLLYLEPALGQAPGLPAAEEFSSPALAHIYSVIRARRARGRGQRGLPRRGADARRDVTSGEPPAKARASGSRRQDSPGLHRQDQRKERA